MSDYIGHTEVKIGSDRQFGLVFAGVFLVLSVVAWVLDSGLAMVALVTAAVFLALAQFAPGVLHRPNVLWFRFGMFLNTIFLPLVMLGIFIIAFVPTGLVFKLRRKDLLHREFDPEATSYWVERKSAPGSMTHQF
jgi:hypothetical protein